MTRAKKKKRDVFKKNWSPPVTSARSDGIKLRKKVPVYF